MMTNTGFLYLLSVLSAMATVLSYPYSTNVSLAFFTALIGTLGAVLWKVLP
jgi:hypothetical protein